jgi:hypothetical protein
MTAMTTTLTPAQEAYESARQGLLRARHAADARGLDADECVTWMTARFFNLVRSAYPDYTMFEGFHGHQVRFIEGPLLVAFSSHPKMV